MEADDAIATSGSRSPPATSKTPTFAPSDLSAARNRAAADLAVFLAPGVFPVQMVHEEQLALLVELALKANAVLPVQRVNPDQSVFQARMVLKDKLVRKDLMFYKKI